jgi:hypothetical protein
MWHPPTRRTDGYIPRECERFDPGEVDVRFVQGRVAVGVVAEIGCDIDSPIIVLGDKIKSAAPQVHPGGQLRKLRVRVRALEVTAHVELPQSAYREGQPAIAGRNSRPPARHADLEPCDTRSSRRSGGSGRRRSGSGRLHLRRGLRCLGLGSRGETRRKLINRRVRLRDREMSAENSLHSRGRPRSRKTPTNRIGGPSVRCAFGDICHRPEVCRCALVNLQCTTSWHLDRRGGVGDPSYKRVL